MFDKRTTTIKEQIEKLKKRGLQITLEDNAEHYFSHISYYRLGEYWYVMQKDKKRHIFKPDSRFKDVISLYSFDRELRILLFDVIEKIEISLRTKMIYHLSHEYNPWWFEDADLFINKHAHQKSIEAINKELERTRENTIVNHRRKYGVTQSPPAWKTLELASFGSLSRIYGNLKNSIKSKALIAKELGAVNHKYLPSWLQSITHIRNYCAHHARLWNKNLSGSPKLLSKPPYHWISDVPQRNEFQKLYIHLCLMKYLLNIIQPKNHFFEKLNGLFEKYPNVDPNALGMKMNWREEPLWKNNKT